MGATADSEAKQPRVDFAFTKDVQFLQRHSPDLALDISVLTYIMVNRRYSPKDYAGWADFPATWYAGRSRVGRRRVDAAVGRLLEYGMIKGMSTNNDPAMAWSRRAPRYRYDLRDYPASEKAEPPSFPGQKEIQTLNPKAQGEPVSSIPPKSAPVQFSPLEKTAPVKEETRPRPPLKAGPDGGYGEVWILGNTRGRTASGKPGEFLMEPVKVAPSDFTAYPICKACHRVMHPTQGAAGTGPSKNLPDKDGYCLGCYFTECVKYVVEHGPEKAFVWQGDPDPVKGYRLSGKAEMREYLVRKNITWSEDGLPKGGEYLEDGKPQKSSL